MVEKRKGLLNQDQEEFLAGVLDEFFKFKNPLMETFDKVAFKLMIQVGDNTGLDKIKEQWKELLIPIIDAAVLLDVEETRRLATDALNRVIDIPELDEDTELMVFDAFTRFVVAAINWYVQKKAAQVPEGGVVVPEG